MRKAFSCRCKVGRATNGRSMHGNQPPRCIRPCLVEHLTDTISGEMGGDLGLRLFASLLLVLGSAFFVAAEYALVSSQISSRLEAMGRRGSKNAPSARLAKALEADFARRSPARRSASRSSASRSVRSPCRSWPICFSPVFKELEAQYRRCRRRSRFCSSRSCLVVIGELAPKYISLAPSRAGCDGHLPPA